MRKNYAKLVIFELSAYFFHQKGINVGRTLQIQTCFYVSDDFHWIFLEKHDFAGKTVIPFCTHEGSGLGSTESRLKKALPSASFKSGLAIQGIVAQHDEKRTRSLVEGWM